MSDPNMLSPGQTQMGIMPTASITRPMPNTKVQEIVHFKLAAPAASMHRQDGKKLAFVNGVHTTSIAEDIRFFRNEIDNEHPLLTELSSEEADTYQRKISPADRLAVEMELRAKLEQEIRAQLAAEGAANKPPKLEEVPVQQPGTEDGAKMAGIDALTKLRQIREAQGAKVVDVASDPRNINPTSSSDVSGAAPESNS